MASCFEIMLLIKIALCSTKIIKTYIIPTKLCNYICVNKKHVYLVKRGFLAGTVSTGYRAVLLLPVPGIGGTPKSGTL